MIEKNYNQNWSKNKIEILKKKLMRNLKDYGLWITLRKTASSFLKPLYYRKSFIIYELNIKTTPKKALLAGDYIFRLLNDRDEKFIHQIEGMEEWLKGKLKARLLSNGVCMAILKSDKVIGFNLATIGEAFIPLLKLKVITRSDEAWSEQITIHKDFRRKGLGSALRNQFYDELRKRGLKALYGHRQEWNVASEKSVQKYTANELIKAEYKRILTFERLRCTLLPSYFSKREDVSSQYEQKKEIMINSHYLKPSNNEYHFTIEIDKLIA